MKLCIAFAFVLTFSAQNSRSEYESPQNIWAREGRRVTTMIETDLRAPTAADISGTWGPPPTTWGPSERMIITQEGDIISGFSIFSSCMGPFPYKISGKRLNSTIKLKFELLGPIPETREEEYSIFERDGALGLRVKKGERIEFVPLKTEK